MNIDQLDEKLINTPLSKGERLGYIKIFLKKIYLDGIDKGTSLENIRIKKIQNIKDKKFDRYFTNFCNYLEEKILIAEKRVYREKYKGRYNYYKPKKAKKKKPPIQKKIISQKIFKQKALWP